MSQKTYMDDLLLLLDAVPMVSEDQAAEYVGRVQNVPSLGPVYRTIHKADSYNRIWREHIRYQQDGEMQEIIMLSRDRAKAKSRLAKDFPYAFWLYLTANNFETPCGCGEHPFCATFNRPQKDGSDVTAQIAVLDCRGNTLPLTLAMEVEKYTKELGRQWFQPYNEPPEVLPATFWRALILLNMPDDFLRSKDFVQLQGVGFTHFFATDDYATPPELVAHQTNPKAAWARFIGKGWS